MKAKWQDDMRTSKVKLVMGEAKHRNVIKYMATLNTRERYCRGKDLQNSWLVYGKMKLRHH